MIPTHTVARRRSRAAVVGGALVTLDVVAHVGVDDTTAPSTMFGLSHEIWHAPGVGGIILVLFGLLGIHAQQSIAAGTAGAIGFVLLVIGITLGAAYSTVFHGIFLPAIHGIDADAATAVTTTATIAQIVRGVVVQALGLGLGALLYGVATLRAGVLSRTGGWALIAGALLAAANEVVPAAQLLSRALFGVAFVALGVPIVKRPAAHARTTLLSPGAGRGES